MYCKKEKEQSECKGTNLKGSRGSFIFEPSFITQVHVPKDPGVVLLVAAKIKITRLSGEGPFSLLL